MKSVDILAFGAHPDDVELGCGEVFHYQKVRANQLQLLI